MNEVFIGGCRRVSNLNPEVRERILMMLLPCCPRIDRMRRCSDELLKISLTGGLKRLLEGVSSFSAGFPSCP